MKLGTYPPPEVKSLWSLSTCSWNLRSSRAYLSENMKCPQPGKGIQHICRRSASSQQSSTCLKSSSELMVVTVGIIHCSLLLVGLWPSVWPRCACGTAGGARRRYFRRDWPGIAGLLQQFRHRPSFLGSLTLFLLMEGLVFLPFGMLASDLLVLPARCPRGLGVLGPGGRRSLPVTSGFRLGKFLPGVFGLLGFLRVVCRGIRKVCWNNVLLGDAGGVTVF